MGPTAASSSPHRNAWYLLPWLFCVFVGLYLQYQTTPSTTDPVPAVAPSVERPEAQPPAAVVPRPDAPPRVSESAPGSTAVALPATPPPSPASASTPIAERRPVSPSETDRPTEVTATPPIALRHPSAPPPRLLPSAPRPGAVVKGGDLGLVLSFEWHESTPLIEQRRYRVEVARDSRFVRRIATLHSNRTHVTWKSSDAAEGLYYWRVALETRQGERLAVSAASYFRYVAAPPLLPPTSRVHVGAKDSDGRKPTEGEEEPWP